MSDLYLVSWLWPESSTPLCVCKSMDDAKRVVADRLENVTPDWTTDERFAHAGLNIVHKGGILQGVLIQQVPLYE